MVLVATAAVAATALVPAAVVTTAARTSECGLQLIWPSLEARPSPPASALSLMEAHAADLDGAEAAAEEESRLKRSRGEATSGPIKPPSDPRHAYGAYLDELRRLDHALQAVHPAFLSDEAKLWLSTDDAHQRLVALQLIQVLAISINFELVLHVRLADEVARRHLPRHASALLPKETVAKIKRLAVSSRVDASRTAHALDQIVSSLGLRTAPDASVEHLLDRVQRACEVWHLKLDEHRHRQRQGDGCSRSGGRSGSWASKRGRPSSAVEGGAVEARDGRATAAAEELRSSRPLMSSRPLTACSELVARPLAIERFDRKEHGVVPSAPSAPSASDAETKEDRIWRSSERTSARMSATSGAIVNGRRRSSRLLRAIGLADARRSLLPRKQGQAGKDLAITVRHIAPPSAPHMSGPSALRTAGGAWHARGLF